MRKLKSPKWTLPFFIFVIGAASLSVYYAKMPPRSDVVALLKPSHIEVYGLTDDNLPSDTILVGRGEEHGPCSVRVHASVHPKLQELGIDKWVLACQEAIAEQTADFQSEAN